MKWEDLMAPNYGTPALTLVEGDGWTVTDSTGRTYVDLVAGIAVNGLGHGHPAIVKAVQQQVGKLAHVSNLYQHPKGLELAERLNDLTGKYCLFTNSGTEANEAAAKLVRRRAHAMGRDDGVTLAFEQGFHGRTAGALALTGQPVYHEGCGPLPDQIVHVPFNDTEALAAAFDEHDVVGVFAEPIQGEGGVIPMDAAFAEALQRQVQAADALLVMDEVQTGIGRTGAWFAHTRLGLDPDVITLAKGLGSGMPIGVALIDPQHATHLGPGTHGCTFGGNPVSCAAAIATLDTIKADGILEQVTENGTALKAALQDAGLKVRGEGLLLGVVLDGPYAKQVSAAMAEAGFLVGIAGPDVVRLAPPLITPRDVLLSAVQALAEAVAGQVPASAAVTA